MKKKVFILSVIAMFAMGNQVTAQKQNDSGILFKMIKVSVPDSIVFTVAEGKEFSGDLSVSLVSGEKVIKGTTSISGSFKIQNINGRTERIYTNKAQFLTEKFGIPIGFKANKIKFETDKNIFYYDIGKSLWEPISSENNQVAIPDSIAQHEKKQSNGIFEMLAVYTPDFVAFRQVLEKEIKEVNIYLVSGTTNIKSHLRRVLYIKSEGWDTFSVSGSEFRFSNFDTSKDKFFKAEKIKIVADGKEMFYNIAKSMWE